MILAGFPFSRSHFSSRGPQVPVRGFPEPGIREVSVRLGLSFALALMASGCGFLNGLFGDSSPDAAPPDAAVVDSAGAPDMAVVANGIGVPCAKDTDCSQGLTCITIFPGGLCALVFAGQCGPASCPPGSGCLQVAADTADCLPACDPQGPACARGGVCYSDADSPRGGVCEPPCHDNASCTRGVCDPASHRCVGLPSGDMGAPPDLASPPQDPCRGACNGGQFCVSLPSNACLTPRRCACATGCCGDGVTLNGAAVAGACIPAADCNGLPKDDCLNPGQQAEGQCMIGADCCSNYCRGFCQDWPKNGDPCSPMGNCNWGVCVNGICSCNPVGTHCQGTHECCSLNCQNGVCAPGLMTEGSPCTENRWCYTGLCLNGRCATLEQDPGVSGQQYTAVCHGDADCISNDCPIGFGGVGNCSCRNAGEACNDDHDCCHLHCVGGACD